MFFGRFIHSAVKTHFAATIRTKEQTREHRHGTHFSRTVLALTDFLYYIESFLIYDCLMCITENLPLGGFIVNLLFPL